VREEGKEEARGKETERSALVSSRQPVQRSKLRVKLQEVLCPPDIEGAM